ncbi:MAG: hypothetical protein RLZZ15_1689, partial [Verrucomicrobiota bacterium]
MIAVATVAAPRAPMAAAVAATERPASHAHLLPTWRALGFDAATPVETWRRECARRFGPAATAPLATALHRAAQVLPLLAASSCFPGGAAPADHSRAECQSLGPSLDAYAKNTGPDPARYENFAEASRRILAGGATAKRTPDLVALELDALADAILADTRAAERAFAQPASSAGPAPAKNPAAASRPAADFAATITDLKILAQLARFHARRSIAAVHYNLFKRGLRLAELLAATYQSREVTAAWRELVALARTRPDTTPDATRHWADELVKLEYDLKDLEAQCCPP